MMTLKELGVALDAHVTRDIRFDRVGTDSRRVAKGELFVALRGPNFDGHQFVDDAFGKGAAAAMVDEAWAEQNPDHAAPLVVVPDTRVALGLMAGAWRARFAIPVIGVTGSNGKTTVKEMCAAIMREWASENGFGADAVLSTVGNLNNDIGLPLTLLELRDHHRAAVVEMGMNRPGEIAELARIARPTVAIVTNAQRAHLQGMGTVAEIAREKGAIYEGCAEGGVAVINADDPHAAYWADSNKGRRTVTFGLENAAEVSGKCVLHGLGATLELAAEQGGGTIELQVPGEHNVRNALGATAACLAAGVSMSAVSKGLSAFTGARGRLQRGPGLNGSVIIDDSYNANPDSVRAAIDVLTSVPGHKILVLGDMGEIGRTSAQVHDEIGGYAKSKGVDALYAVGEMGAVAARNFGEGGVHFKTHEALVQAIAQKLDADTTVLVKGSRFMKMERVADSLSAAHSAEPSTGEGRSDAA